MLKKAQDEAPLSEWSNLFTALNLPESTIQIEQRIDEKLNEVNNVQVDQRIIDEFHKREKQVSPAPCYYHNNHLFVN